MANEHTTKVSTALIWFATLINTTNFTVVIPTADKCGVGPPALAGLMVGLFPVSKAIMNGPSTIFIERFSIRAFFFGVCTFQIIGNILYAVGPACGTIGVYVVSLTGRFLVGAFGGQLLNGSFVARGFPVETRSSAMLLMQSAQATAYVLGPLLGGLLELLCTTMGFNGSLLNGCTAPGWFMSMMSLLLLVAAICCFEEPPKAQKKSKAVDIEAGKQSAAVDLMPWGRLAFAYTLVFLVQTTLGSWEMHTEFTAVRSWGWEHSEAGFYLAACMLLAVPSTLFGSRITNLLADRNAIRLMLCCLAPCATLLLPFILGPSEQKGRQIVLYSIGSTGFTVFALVAAGLTKSLITKMTPIPLRQRAVGIMATASAIGRASGPLVASSSDAASAGGYVMFALVLLLLGTVFFGFEALRPCDDVAKAETTKTGSEDKSAGANDSMPKEEQEMNDCGASASVSTSEGSSGSCSDNSCLGTSEGCRPSPADQDPENI